MALSLALLPLFLALLLQESFCSSGDTIPLLSIGQTYRTTFKPLQNYTITVDASSAWYSGNYSAFTLQLHTQTYNITLRNTSSECTVSRLCTTRGTNVGFVELLLTQERFSYVAGIDRCGENSTSCVGVANVSVLIAVVGVPALNPIPGGCAQTSALEYEAAVTTSYDSQSTTIAFQDSDIGFAPSYMHQGVPACDSSARYMQRLEYHIYRQCISAGDFGESSVLDAVQTMLDPVAASSQVYTKLKYSDPKRALFDSISGRGIVYNVVVRDTTSGLTSPYIPVTTYSCDFASGGCKKSIPLSSYILGPLLGLIGLFLCFLAHRLFHLEIFLMSVLVGFFLVYLTLSATTQWNSNVLLGSSVGISLVISLLLFVFWFFTGYYYIFVIFFGLAMGSLISATLMFTPLDSMISVLDLNYIYILGFLCVAVICIVPLVAFPVVLNIVSTSVIGSYSIVFCISLFKYTQLQDILVRVVKNASISGFLSAYSGCTFDTIDIACCCVWILLTIAGVTVQLTIHWVRKKRYEKERQRNIYGMYFRKFSGFPQTSLFRRLIGNRKRTSIGQVRGRRQVKESTRPLLSPNTSPTRSVNYGTTGNT